jgi:hypothetical protein
LIKALISIEGAYEEVFMKIPELLSVERELLGTECPFG